ncbi:MAG: hypothetical protein RLN70_07260, partial [Rhodospirillaceae bacterium]
LFMGELYIRRTFPAMRTGYPTEWVETINNALAMDVTWYVPGHGFIEDAETMKNELIEARKSIEFVNAEAKRLYEAGVPCEMASPDGGDTCEAAEQADWGPYESWTMRAALEPFAVVKMYQEIEGRLP